MKETTVSQITSMLGGRLKGDITGTDLILSGTCPIDKYIAGRVAYVGNTKYIYALSGLADAVVVLPNSMESLADQFPQNTYVVVEDALEAMMDLQLHFYADQYRIAQQGIASTATVDGTASLGKEVLVGDQVWIGNNVVIGDGIKILASSYIADNVIIGDNSIIYPGVRVMHRTSVGANCILHPGVCIGSDGFRFEQNVQRGEVRKWLHAGTVSIGDNVEIGANATIDRASFEGDATVIGNHAKLDDQVHIGHNASIGARTLIAAQTCVSGSAKIGEDVWIGAAVTISNGVKVGNEARLLLNAVVASDVSDGVVVSGFYAMPHRKWMRAYAKLKSG